MEKLNAILRKHIAAEDDMTNKLLGAAFIVVGKDGIVYQGSAGRTSLATSLPAFTPDTVVWAASMSKIITITGVMSLVERGVVSLDDGMRAVVPELGALQILRGFTDDGEPILEDNDREISLRHLLTHTAGLGADVADPDLMRWSAAVGRTATCLDYTLEGWTVPLKFPPGEGWYYGGATEFAGVAVERITAKRLDDVMGEEILKKLGMRDTTFYRDSEGFKGRVPGCMMRDADGGLSEVPVPVPAEPELLSLGSGLYTTAGDHAKVLQSLLRSTAGEEGLLRKETVDEMFRPQLNEPQRAVLKAITDMFHDGMVPEFPEGMLLDHGISGIINLEDVPGKRRKGSMMWQGMANGHWWVDRESGIAGTLFVNVLPQGDAAVIRLYDELERAVYGDLLPGLSIQVT
ncbi:beta-lactamase/transpeptidase-like protein [Lasiosphaeria hispida]|uniref:Beta-lactamase/transpeptidase-like protein n=1 Tax=Lasiosphaeria hispida TaxID=260671 RepID=A0AAJ0HBD0_9PEZI|nr:beta-lactamase/transpeptidase-like protein [Lasiosphaeria hispida]